MPKIISVDKAISVYLQWLKKEGYKKSTIEFYRSRCKAIKIVVSNNNGIFDYDELLQKFKDYSQFQVLSMQYGFIRCLKVLHNILNKGNEYKDSTAFKTGYKKKEYIHNQQFTMWIESYSARLLSLGFAKNTISFRLYCAISFLAYLESIEIGHISNLNRTTVDKYFSNKLKSLNPATKQAMAYRIRDFLQFLREIDVINKDCILLVNTRYAKKFPCTTILNDDEQIQICRMRKRITGEKDSRNYAMVLLAWRLMLRSSDIVRLKLSDIDWQQKVIRIVQHKTKKSLALPLPDDVGDALALYIVDYRPRSQLETIFLTLKTPVKPLKSINGVLVSLFKSFELPLLPSQRGTHILRRTGASNLLATGNKPDMIAFSLGHSNDLTVSRYLATHKEIMADVCGNLTIVGTPEVHI